MGKRTYNSEKTRRTRQLKLNQMYTDIFSDKDMLIFEFSKIDELLRNSSSKHRIRIFNTIIYLLKNNIIHDDILARLLSFESHFTTHTKLYRDFTYLMRTSIYDIFINDKSVMNSEYVISIFFSVCEEQSLHDNEILSITNDWCETIKIDTILTASMRKAKLSAVHTLAQNLFSAKGIDELELSDLTCTNHIALLMEYLEFIDARHQLSKDFHYLISFKELLVGKGVDKFKIMCTSDNIFQFIGIKREHRANCIYKTDVPYGTPLYEDIVEYIMISRYRSTAFTRIIEHFYASMGNYAVTDAKVSNVDIEHYIDMDIMTMMEAVHGIVVGNVNLQGKIVKQIPTDIAKTENEVSHGCGYCQSECCTNFTYLDCIMCKDFVTMPSRLPFFEAQIKKMDVHISKAKTPHDKEDYVNIKRLLVAYESAIKTAEVTE